MNRINLFNWLQCYDVIVKRTLTECCARVWIMEAHESYGCNVPYDDMMMHDKDTQGE